MVYPSFGSETDSPFDLSSRVTILPVFRDAQLPSTDVITLARLFCMKLIVFGYYLDTLQTAISSSNERPLLHRTETVLYTFRICRYNQIFMVLVTLVMDMIREPARPSQPPALALALALDRTCA